MKRIWKYHIKIQKSFIEKYFEHNNAIWKISFINFNIFSLLFASTSCFDTSIFFVDVVTTLILFFQAIYQHFSTININYQHSFILTTLSMLLFLNYFDIFFSIFSTIIICRLSIHVVFCQLFQNYYTLFCD